MWMLGIAVLLTVLKVLVWMDVFQWQALAELSWAWIFGVYLLCAIWFEYEDLSGLRKKKALQRLEKNKQQRFEKMRDHLYMRRKR